MTTPTFPPRKHVILSTMTGLEAHFINEPRCVKCGKVIQRGDVQGALDAGLAPCCYGCSVEVDEEIKRYFPFWPQEWFGHWSKTSSEHIWMLDN